MTDVTPLATAEAKKLRKQRLTPPDLSRPDPLAVVALITATTPAGQKLRKRLMRDFARAKKPLSIQAIFQWKDATASRSAGSRSSQRRSG